ncbi:hypothetical protein FRX31_020669, partial [Thalictrum thalictroides]
KHIEDCSDYKGTNKEDITLVILLLLSASWTLGVDHNKRVEFSTGYTNAYDSTCLLC